MLYCLGARVAFSFAGVPSQVRPSPSYSLHPERTRQARMGQARQAMAARLAELFRYRELIRNLVVRDLKVRYRNSVLGFLWSLLNPWR